MDCALVTAIQIQVKDFVAISNEIMRSTIKKIEVILRFIEQIMASESSI